MFLNKLDAIEKEAFISLSYHAAKANGEITDSEYQMLIEYCKEMDILFFDAEKVKTIDDIIEIYGKADASIKKIVVLELLGLLYADGLYDEKEKAFMKEFVVKIGLPEMCVEKFERLIMEYLDLFKTISEEVFVN